MAQYDATQMKVSVQELPERRVIGMECKLDTEGSDYNVTIEECFQQLHDWARGQGHEPTRGPNVGVPRMDGGKLKAYLCSIEAPEGLEKAGDDVHIMELKGGTYAVLKIKRDPTTIGQAIALFYEEYVPHNQVSIDSSRPIYELYHDAEMDYCVPIRGSDEIAPGPA